MVISNIYLAIFLPLLASLFCQIFNKRNFPFYIAIFSSLLLSWLLAKSFLSVLNNQIIASDFNLSLISLGLEFRIDLMSEIFLLAVIFIKIVTLFFYQKDVKDFLDEKTSGNFYAVFLLNIFALFGIFSSNNIFNLFLFIEIYGFSYFSLFRFFEGKVSSLSIDYFVCNAISSLLLLAMFVAIYLVFGEINFDKIALAINNSASLDLEIFPIFFILIFVVLLVKFFPFWLYFEKIKRTNPIADFLMIDTLFIKTSIGMFLGLKFLNNIFVNKINFLDINFSLLLLIFGSLLVIYSSYKIFLSKHLKIIAAYSCINNIAFIVICLLLQRQESTKAALLYFLNFILVNLFIFLFAGFIKKHYRSSSINKIWMVRKNNFLLTIPLKVMIFFIAGFPFTLLFFANWNLASAALNLNYKIVIFSAILVSIATQLDLGRKLVTSFFNANAIGADILPFLGIKKHCFYLLAFCLLITAVFAASFLTSLI